MFFEVFVGQFTFLMCGNFFLFFILTVLEKYRKNDKKKVGASSVKAVYSGGFRAPERSSLPGPGVWSIRCGFVCLYICDS